MSYNDAIKRPTNASVKFVLPQYTRWNPPLTEIQLQFWNHLALQVKDAPGFNDPSLGMPIITSWVDQRTRHKQKRYEAKHVSLGLCLFCPDKVQPGFRVCEGCRETRFQYLRRYRAEGRKKS